MLGSYSKVSSNILSISSYVDNYTSSTGGCS
nr:MAG TPA: hypothetical protein [Caudoviricetes sp.]